jgi:hypothetical protein
MPLARGLTKKRTFMQPPPPAQRSDLILPLLDTRTSLRAFQILEEVCLASGFRSGAAVSRRGYDYFFRFDVFFATFLVAFAVFFAFFAFLAMSSSSKKWLSELAHAEYRHAQH